MSPRILRSALILDVGPDALQPLRCAARRWHHQPCHYRTKDVHIDTEIIGSRHSKKIAHLYALQGCELDKMLGCRLGARAHA